MVGGIEQRGVLGECDGVLSGYMGGADIGAAILDAVATVKRANPSARYCCDPVIGDVGRGIFVREGIPEFMKEKAVPAADIVTPNQFELDYLAGRESRTLADVLAAVKAVHALGPRAVLVTSLHVDDTPEDAIDLLASDATGRFRLRTPKLHLAVNGAGDAIAALFFAHYLRSGKIDEALSKRGFGDLRRADENRGSRRARKSRSSRRSRRSSSRAGCSRRKNYDGVAMSEAASVVHVDRLQLAFAPQALGLCGRAARRDRCLVRRAAAREAGLWNGRVLLLHEHAVADGVFRGRYLETDYASFAAWRHWGRPAAAVYDCFGAAAILAADGAFLLGVMGPHTANAGRIYFPCGTPDPDDIVGGRVDLDFSVRRELKEETGLDMSRIRRRAGLDDGVRPAADRAYQGVAQPRQAPRPCARACSHHLARERQPELADIRIVRGAADFDPAMPRFVTAFLAQRFAVR